MQAEEDCQRHRHFVRTFQASSVGELPERLQPSTAIYSMPIEEDRGRAGAEQLCAGSARRIGSSLSE